MSRSSELDLPECPSSKSNGEPDWLNAWIWRTAPTPVLLTSDVPIMSLRNSMDELSWSIASGANVRLELCGRGRDGSLVGSQDSVKPEWARRRMGIGLVPCAVTQLLAKTIKTASAKTTLRQIPMPF